MANTIRECWPVDAVAPGLDQIVVELRLRVDASGMVRQVQPNGSRPPSDPRALMVHNAARHALLNPRCNPLPLSREGIAILSSSVFRFSPGEFGLQ